MTRARQIAESAADTYLDSLDDAPEDDRQAFIAGYLRARADALKADSARIEAVDRLLTIAGEP